MPRNIRSDENLDLRPETGRDTRPIPRPKRSIALGDTQPIQRISPDDVGTEELPGSRDAPTPPVPRMPNGTAPTASLPRRVPPPRRAGYLPPRPPQPPVVLPVSRAGGDGESRHWGRVLMSAAFAVVVTVVLLFFLAFAAVVVGYATIASQLPSPGELQTRQTIFVSSKIYDREGNLLYEVTDPHGGRRTYVPLDDISLRLIQATIATEDRDFYAHPGFDPVAIIRAFYYNFSEGRIVSGASTIPQQLARSVLLTPEERVRETAWRKIKEIVLATELTRTYPKDVILEIYLNEIYYGNLAYGVQAAAETYFNVDAAELTLGQASFLAGLPQSPATYDPFGGGYDLARARHENVLALMVEAGYIGHTDAALAAAEVQDYEFRSPLIDITSAPHFVVYARQSLEATYGPEALYRGTSLRIYTTLDPHLQALAEQAVREGVAALADRSATNGALVALDPATGYIRAMVGSADFYNEEIDGQVNVALRCRQPGSSIKPLTYIASFERGWTPATLLWDIRTEFPDGTNPPYVPVNYDREYHGPMLMRGALANSYNVPAVDTLQFVGVDGLLEMTTRLGIKSLAHPEQHCPDYPYEQPPAYGLALTLGGGEVKLLEMAGAFAVFANGGAYVPPNPILRIEDSRGNILVDNSSPAGEQVVSPQHAHMITSILSDTEARCIEFRCPSVLELSRPAAAKTGTTDDYRDAWTVGYTPDLVTGVWVGNSDNSEMVSLPGSAGAGPIWHDFMEAAHADLPVRGFVVPPGIVQHEICADSGTLPTKHCPRRKREVFAEDQPPLDASHDWYQMMKIDAFTGLLANEFCPDHVSEQLMIVIEDARGRDWAQAHPGRFKGLPLAPVGYCTESTGRPEVLITQPASGSVVHGIVPVVGVVQLPNFDHYEAQYGVGDDPQGWGWISGPHLAQVRDGLLTDWDTSHLAPGRYTLRITAFDREQHSVDARVQINVTVPTETPTRTPSPTLTPLPSFTPTATTTLPPTSEPSPTPTNTPLPEPSSTPTESPSPTFTPTIGPTPIVTPTVEITATPPITSAVVITSTSAITPAP